jgi:ferredoxin
MRYGCDENFPHIEGDSMTWVIGPLCVDNMDTSCVDVCPVDCIHLYTGDDPNIPKNLLLIDPVECIDCSACEPACPWEAIYADSDVPPEFAEYTEINARIAGQTDIVQTPNFDKPDPSPEDVEANRQKWLELYRNKAVGP